MPEGDTLFRTAVSLRQVLEGRRLAAVHGEHGRPLEDLSGRTVAQIESRGKHLLIHLAGGDAIHSHLGMTGSWHIYAAGQPWRKPVRQAALALETDAARTAVLFSPKTLEILSADGLRRHRWLSRLGPDLLAHDFDVERILTRLRRHAAAPIGVAIMDQSVACGAGNVYKSEVLFLEQANPFARVDSLSDPQWQSVFCRTRDLMRRNLMGYPRTTRFGRDGTRKWVYGRSGEACLRCGRLIQMRRQGELGRSTYFCPSCQSVGG